MKKCHTNVLDYRRLEDFLQDFYESQKKLVPLWSLGVWASKLSLSSRGTLTMIIKGQRNPSDELTERLIEYFKFEGVEKDHFLELVAFKKFNSDQVFKNRVMNSISHTQETYSIVLDDESFSLICHWYTLAIREMFLLENFVQNAHWIQQKLMQLIPLEKITSSIQSLLKVGLLKKDGERLYSDRSNFCTTSGVPSDSIKNYQLENLELIRHAILEVPVKDRLITSSVFSIKKDRLEEAKDLINKFEENFYKLIEEKPGDTVMTLNIQLFPLTKDVV